MLKRKNLINILRKYANRRIKQKTLRIKDNSLNCVKEIMNSWNVSWLMLLGVPHTLYLCLHFSCISINCQITNQSTVNQFNLILYVTKSVQVSQDGISALSKVNTCSSPHIESLLSILCKYVSKYPTNPPPKKKACFERNFKASFFFLGRRLFVWIPTI